MIGAFLGLILKDLRVLAADRTSLVFVAVFPLTFGMVFGAILSDRQDFSELDVVVVGSSAPQSSALLAALDARERITLEFTDDRFDAERRIRKQQIDAVLIIDDAPLLQTMRTAPSVTIIADAISPARSVLAGELSAAAADAMLGPDQSSALIDIEYALPSASAAPPDNPFALTFPQAIVWALLGASASFGMALLAEHRTGVIMRLRVAPIHPWMILGSKAATCAIIALIIAAALITIGTLWFNVQIASPLMLAASVLASVFAFAGIMVLIASLGRGREAAGQFAWAILLVLAMTGGAMLPIAFMPDWLHAISFASPVRWTIESIEGSIWRDWSIARAAPQWLGLVAVGGGSFLAGARILHRAALD